MIATRVDWRRSTGGCLRRFAVAVVVVLVVGAVATLGAGWYLAGLVLSGAHPAVDADPKTVCGLDFSTVAVRGDLGDAPAWYVPPTVAPARGTWVIAVHGRGGSRMDALYVSPTLAAAGMPILIISNRNDDGAPRSPDGKDHLGDTEWRDVAAAVMYARGQGASGVVLYGLSMGGAVVMTALRRSAPAEAALVRGVILDSPVLDWNATLDMRASRLHLPSLLTWTSKRLVEQRGALSLADFDQLRYVGALKVPVLLFVDRSDVSVVPGPSEQFAAARPDLVTLVTTTGGGHLGSWNIDPAGYKKALRDFLSAHA